MRRIFDIHCHVYPEKIASKASAAIGKFYDIDMNFDGSFKSLKNDLAKTETAVAAIHSAATTPSQVSAINKFISECVKSEPDRFIGFGTLHPLCDDIESHVEEMLSLGLRGIKIHPDFQKFNLDSPEAFAMFETVGTGCPFSSTWGTAIHFFRPRKAQGCYEAFSECQGYRRSSRRLDGLGRSGKAALRH